MLPKFIVTGGGEERERDLPGTTTQRPVLMSLQIPRCGDDMVTCNQIIGPAIRYVHTRPARQQGHRDRNSGSLYRNLWVQVTQTDSDSGADAGTLLSALSLSSAASAQSSATQATRALSP